MRRLAGAIRRALDRHLFRIRKAEPLPAELGHRRIFVLPTGAGVGFGVTLATMLIASMNYGLSLGYGLTFLLAGVGLVSMHHAFRNLVHLQLRSVGAAPVFCGQRAVFRASFDNPSPRPRPALTLYAADSELSRFSIEANSGCSVAIELPATARGWLESGRLTLETRFPLGLVRAWSVLTPAAHCLVYPRPETPAPPFPAPSSEAGQVSDGKAGQEDFAGLRPYRPGDSPRHIAWKMAARDDTGLQTKQFRGGGSVRLEFDWADLPERLDVEARLSRLARWVIDADAAGARYGLVLPGTRSGFGQGPAHLERCLRALALHGIDEHAH